MTEHDYSGRGSWRPRVLVARDMTQGTNGIQETEQAEELSDGGAIGVHFMYWCTLHRAG